MTTTQTTITEAEREVIARATTWAPDMVASILRTYTDNARTVVAALPDNLYSMGKADALNDVLGAIEALCKG